jgi:hypothetical protein
MHDQDHKLNEHRMDTISTTSASASSIHILPDETLVEIVHWLPTKDIVQWTRTCRRTQALLQTPTMVSQVQQARHLPSSLSIWEQLAWYEQMQEFGLLNENRIGFEMASMDILDDSSCRSEDDDEEEDEDGEEEDGASVIRANLQRISKVRRLLQTFPRLQVTVDSHCGTFGPLGIAGRFSRARGMVVVDELTRYGNNTTHEDAAADGDARMKDFGGRSRVTLNAWGRRIADNAAMGGSTHPHTALAKKGKGWVEIFLVLDGIELPSRPDYYKGFVAVNHEVNLELYLPPSRTRVFTFRLFQDTSSSSSEEEEESDREEDGAEEMDYEEDEGNAEEVVGDSDASLG